MTLINPVTQYEDNPKQEKQSGTGLDADLDVAADHGEGSYVGSGKLVGRRALITGADSGIGRAVAIAFAREGADIAMNYLPEEQEDADNVVAALSDTGRKIVQLPTDLTDEQGARKVVTDAVEQLGGLDVLVLVAGKQQAVEDIVDITSEQFDQTYKTNVYAMFWMIQEAVPHLPPGSTIINTSSIQAYSPSPNLVDYASTKGAINTFSKALAQQLAPKGIRVNVVAPGPVWTPLQVSGGQPTEALSTFGEDTPLGRMGQPIEMAPAYVFLASPESSYVVGETLNLNGGMPTP
jgi:NAD(P)-dependent dehydrogenase (short-subunit alcohol dehydrogenase family)